MQTNTLNKFKTRHNRKGVFMKNYLDEIYTVSEFKRDNPALAEQAERAIPLMFWQK